MTTYTAEDYSVTLIDYWWGELRAVYGYSSLVPALFCHTHATALPACHTLPRILYTHHLPFVPLSRTHLRLHYLYHTALPTIRIPFDSPHPTDLSYDCDYAVDYLLIRATFPLLPHPTLPQDTGRDCDYGAITVDCSACRYTPPLGYLPQPF